MLATVPGGPKTSYVRCLGLKGAVLLILVSAYEGRFSEPKMPCSRDTVNPPAPITSSTTSGIHSRLRTPKIVNPFHLSTLGRHVSCSTMQLHVGRDTPDGGPRMRRASPGWPC